MKKTAMVLGLALLTIASGSYFCALAEPPGPPQGPPPFGAGFFGGHPGPPPGPPPFGLLSGPPALIEKLKLTDDQRKQMRRLFVDFENNSRKTRMALLGLHDEKRTMLLSGKIDHGELAKLDEQITELASEVMTEDLKMHRDLLSKLTPEQIDRIAIFSDKGDPARRRWAANKLFGHTVEHFVKSSKSFYQRSTASEKEVLCPKMLHPLMKSGFSRTHTKSIIALGGNLWEFRTGRQSGY